MNKDELIKKFESDIKKRNRMLRFLLALDQMVNVLLWNGSQDETISSHIGRRIESGQATRLEKALCRLLRLIESKHCIKSKGE